MHAITVRQAVFADLDALADLFDQYRQFQGQRSDIARALAFLAARFDHGESIAFLAFARDLPIGFAQLYPSFSSVSLRRVFILNDLFVQPAARRLKAASALLRAVESHAWAHGAARVTLSVARDNLTAQRLYDRSGWRRDEVFHMLHLQPPAD